MIRIFLLLVFSGAMRAESVDHTTPATFNASLHSIEGPASVAERAANDQIWHHYWQVTSTLETQHLPPRLYQSLAKSANLQEGHIRLLFRYGLYFDGQTISLDLILRRYPHYSPSIVTERILSLHASGLLLRDGDIFRFSDKATELLQALMNARQEGGLHTPLPVLAALTKITQALELEIGTLDFPYTHRRRNRFRLNRLPNGADHEFDIFFDLLAARNLIAHNRFDLLGKTNTPIVRPKTPLSVELLDGITGGWLTTTEMCSSREQWGHSFKSCARAFSELVELGLIEPNKTEDFVATSKGMSINSMAGAVADAKFYRAFNALSLEEYQLVKAYLTKAK